MSRKCDLLGAVYTRRKLFGCYQCWGTGNGNVWGFFFFFPPLTLICLPSWRKDLALSFLLSHFSRGCQLGTHEKKYLFLRKIPRVLQSSLPVQALLQWFYSVVLWCNHVFFFGLDVLSSEYFSYTSWFLTVTPMWDWDSPAICSDQ